MCVYLKSVFSEDDCGKLKAKTQIIQDVPSKTHIMLVNKNIAPSKITDGSRRKRGCLPGHPQALDFWCP
jgi:hypothetical protein